MALQLYKFDAASGKACGGMLAFLYLAEVIIALVGLRIASRPNALISVRCGRAFLLVAALALLGRRTAPSLLPRQAGLHPRRVGGLGSLSKRPFLDAGETILRVRKRQRLRRGQDRTGWDRLPVDGAGMACATASALPFVGLASGSSSGCNIQTARG